MLGEIDENNVQNTDNEENNMINNPLSNNSIEPAEEANNTATSPTAELVENKPAIEDNGHDAPKEEPRTNYSINNYYKENYKKTKKSNTSKYVLVSILSSIIGGLIVAAMFIFVAPVVQPSIKGLLGNTETNNTTGNTESQQLKRIEIVQSKEDAATSVAEKVGPSVVGIKSTSQNASEIFGVQSSDGEGSGIIISSDGYILTNYHVIADVVNNKTRSVRENAKLEVFLPSRINKPYSATVKGYDSKTDLAIIKISETNLPAIEFGDSNSVKVGEQVIAVGNPGGLEYMGSVTTGVISGLNRTVELDAGKKMKLIQTDAAINPGNSGGALVNMKGQLIGVNTVKMVATGFEGLGFAIPVNEAKSISDQLLKNNYISRPYLGIQVDQRYTEEVAKQNNMPMGVYVADVEILGAAQKAGIKSQDIIVKFDKKSVKSYDELEAQKNKFNPGDKVSVEVYRDGKTITLDVILGESK